MEGFSIAEVAAIGAVFAAVFTALKVLGEWLSRWIGLEGAVQDKDRSSIKARLDKHEHALENWYRELHDRISREQDARQSADKELVSGLHRLEVEMMEKFATKADLMSAEARIIDAFNRNMDRREADRRRNGQP